MPAFEVKGRRLARGQSLTLDVLVSPNGRINSVRVVEGIDNEELRQAAVGAVLRWRFGGGSHRGVPVRVWVPVQLTFYLESGQLRAAVTSLGN
jgi:TonB family protein